MIDKFSHRRYNSLTGEWILVAPHRTKRPWQGQVEKATNPILPTYDPNCYLCPGNRRAGGEVNPDYSGTFAFVNDYSALSEQVPDFSMNENDLLIARTESGICKVICFSPDHSLTLAKMTATEIAGVINLWKSEYEILGRQPKINYVQIFENKGEMMGCSNPHPHGQIWAQESIPVEPGKEQSSQLNYFLKTGQKLLVDYLNLERKKSERIVFENEGFAVLVPFWATWPYETMILPRTGMCSLNEMDDKQVLHFAEAIRVLTGKYDQLFGVSFPYSAGIHQSPTDGLDHAEWQLHMHFYPPLLRSATIRKFMVGYELLANAQRDITPEWSAKVMQDLQ